MFVLSILSFASWNAGIPFPFFPVAPLAFIGMGRLLQVLFWLIYLISSFNILRLREWARILAVRFSGFVVIISILCLYDIIKTPANYFNDESLTFISPQLQAIIPEDPFLKAIFIPIFIFAPVLICTLFWFFFTRPKVKEQFKRWFFVQNFA